ncbi:MAG TPA: chromosome segregation protein SMC [Candidatus Limnocylindria bacterium]|nr:chromosome segregation protein SMC [Candidatus Limnocylindria bacterium]
MTRLKELRLHGFKSFAEPTRFVFEPGVTAVIGPNGSGKSNMADAIRWVLGEQSNRSLRTRRSDDVIFAGSESRKPIGMAEVSLTFDNHDGWLPIEFEEVTIARRAYRSGDPEYLINGSRARLRDVVELLAGGRLGANELVVVGQGTVDAALSLRPEERRQLFEEAAGVKSLQVRRNEAMARLGKARDNLTRMSDLVRELKPQVRRLALQAEHQEAHDRLGLRARALVQEHHARRAQILQTSLGEARRRSAALSADAEAERSAQASGRQAVAEAEAAYWSAEDETRRASAAWEAAREAAIRAEGRHDSLTERDLDLEAEVRRIEQELTELAENVPPVGPGAVAEIPAPRGARAEAAAAEARWRAAAERARLAGAQALTAEEALSEVRVREADRLARAGRGAEEAAAAAARHEAAARDLAVVESRISEVTATVDRLAETRTAAAAELARAEQAATAAITHRAALEEEASRAAVVAAELDERRSRMSAERADLERQRAGGGADPVARLRSGGWEQPTALGSVPQEAAVAVAAVLGDVERALVWKSGADAAVGDAVSGTAAGEARLLVPADRRPPGRPEALAAVGATQTVAELLRDRSAPEVLHRTVIAPDLGALLSGWDRLPDGWAAVTLAGDLADARGMVTVRGQASTDHRVGSRTARLAELTALADEITREADDTNRRLTDARANLQAARDAADTAQAQAEAARAVWRRAEEDGIAAAADAERLSVERDRLVDALAELPLPGGAPEPSAVLDGEIASLEAAAAEARAAREVADADRDAARQAWEAAVRLADEEDASAGDQRASAARHAERTDQLQRAIARIASERAVVGESLREAAATLAAARSAEADAAERRATAEDAREAARQGLLEAERHLGGGAGRMAELEAGQQQTVADVSRLEEALAGLERERELSLEGLPEAATDAEADPEGPEPTALSEEELAEELRKTRRTLHQIGSVNPFAIEEHRELSTRLEELTVQETDLRAAADSTEELIGRLDEEISSQFQAAFAAIGQRFDEYCRLLFDGGSASLELTNEAEGESSNGVEAPGGIEIAVRPPGKRLQRLAMLSGGERALAGVALLFAMLTVNPVPFCVLDEVDAALDEANIGRFADALRRLAQTIDFVVITHNRATIETADTIYGVTMTDAAVSRVLSLRLADLPVEVPA